MAFSFHPFKFKSVLKSILILLKIIRIIKRLIILIGTLCQHPLGFVVVVVLVVINVHVVFNPRNLLSGHTRKLVKVG